MNSLAKGKGESGLLGGLGEILSTNAEVADFECVLRDESLHRTRTILNGEIGTIGLV